MNVVETVLLENIEKPNSCFIFPTDVAASRWADHVLRLKLNLHAENVASLSAASSSAVSGTIAMNKFIAWDVFKQNSIRSKVQNKKSIPSALRKIFISRLVKENADLSAEGRTPVFSSLIPAKWAGQAAQFTPWLTGLLPQLGAWLKKTTGAAIDSILGGNAEKLTSEFEADDRDLFVMARRYAHFLEEHSLFEPAWETPPFNDTGTECFIFFPESLSDYSEYRELLAASSHVKTISAQDGEQLPCDTFFYTNSRAEITEAALYIRALHENKGINWEAIAVCLPDSENYEPYVLREFTIRNIPFVKRSGKPLADYPAGQFFRAVIDCASRNFAFSAVSNLLLNKNLPWKNAAHIHNLIEFGIKNNCISSWVEEKDGKERHINVWEDAFEKPFGYLDPDARRFFGDLKRRLLSLRTASSFAELRRQYFIFRERFFDMGNCSPETDLVFSRCISELMYLVEIEKNFPDAPAPDPFAFLIEYLSEVNYLAQQSASGVTILPYRTAAPAPFDCHIILGADQGSLSVVFPRLDFLPRAKREKLGIADEDASAAFINLHRFNSQKKAAFFCSEQTFSGYKIPHSRLGAPSRPLSRYASITGLAQDFAIDYFNGGISTDGKKPKKLHNIQKQGFEEWKTRRKQISKQDKKQNQNNTLHELIRGQLAENSKFPGKYSVSASSMEPYFHCSLKWLFNNVLSIENEEIEASLMAENISGMLYHTALNLFFVDIKNGKQQLLPPEYEDQKPRLPSSYNELLERSINEIFSLFPALQTGGKPQMSAITARILEAEKNNILANLKKCLSHFLSYFAGCRVTGSEISYQAQRDFYFLNGKLDCVLQSARDEYIIVDFKLKWIPDRTDCTGDEEYALCNFQLPMYITLTEENEKIKVNTALFFSILDAKPQVIFGAIENADNNEIIPKKEGNRIQRESAKFSAIIGDFNQKAEQFASEIKTGNFTVYEKDFNECNKCNYHRICRTIYKINRGNIYGAK